MTVVRRQCSKCGRNRALKFFKPRGRVCASCQRGRVSLANREVRLQETYGLSLDDVEAVLVAQDRRCAICKGTRTYNLDCDHDHALEKAGVPPRGTVRGFLCRNCNRRILRSARDDAALLRAAADYLENPPARRILGVSSTEASL